MVGPTDAFVTKLNAAGTSLVYSGYLGGSAGVENGQGIDVGTSGAAFVTGSTASTNFPMASALDNTLGGSTAAFVTQLAPDGASLDFSTFLGGTNGGSIGWAIAVDSPGNMYVTGVTTATDFPTVDAIRSSPSSGSDGFVTKLAPNRTGIIYSTYFGGEAFDTPLAIESDNTGAAYISGHTESVSTFPFQAPRTLVIPFDASNGTGPTDGFVSKIGEPASISFSVAAQTVPEDSGKVTITVERVGGNSGDVTVTLGTSDGTAKGGADFTIAEAPVNFPDGDDADKTKDVTIKVGETAEPGETFTVTLSDPTGGATIGPVGTVVITIGNDDGVPIPSLTTWGLAALALAFGALLFVRRRRRVPHGDPAR